MLLGMTYELYILFKLEMEVIGPLFYIYIIIFVLTAYNDLLNGTKFSLNAYKLSRVHHIPQLVGCI